MEMMLRHQNTMLALRQQMGWPAFKPANDCIAFSSGKPGDFEIGIELGRIAQALGKDMIYSGWASAGATAPIGFSIAYRELLAVDFIDRVLPYAANDDAPVVLVSIRTDEHFAIDRRGSLVRIPGRPKSLAAGRRLAIKRIKSAAKTMGNDLLTSNRRVVWGSTEIEPEAPIAECIVRFG